MAALLTKNNFFVILSPHLERKEQMKTQTKSLARRIGTYLFCLLFVSCAGMERGFSSCSAENFGADWVVVQMDNNGRPYRCWELHGVSISNEDKSDGIYWKSDRSGNLVHISGNYNRVQIVGGNWDDAFAEVGLTPQSCRQIRTRTVDPAK
jgi:hypothetical protein